MGNSDNRDKPSSQGFIKKRLFLFSLILLFSGLILTCEWPDYFAAYRGTNLIATRDFGKPGAWQLSRDNLEMAFEEYSEPLPAEAPEGSKAYLLSINNLFPNGDFSGTTAGDPPLLWVSTAADFLVVDSTAPRSINSGTLRMNFDASTQFSEIDLINLSPAPSEGESYLVRFNYRIIGDNAIGYIFPGFSDQETLQRTGSEEIFSFPDPLTQENHVFTITEGQILLSFGEKDVEQFYLDDLRIMRSDTPLELALSIDRLNSTDLELLPGLYEFSFYLKQRGNPGESLGENRYAASAVTYGIRLFDNEGYKVGEQASTEILQDLADFSWERVVVSMNCAFTRPFGEELFDNYRIELFISPTASTTSGRDVGEILITYPRLEYLPD